GQLQRLADAFGSRPGTCEIELNPAARERRRIDPSEQQVSVRHGGLGAAAAVADRAGLGAGTLRPNGDPPERVHTRDRSSAGADLDHLDDRNAQWQTPSPEAAVN